MAAAKTKSTKSEAPKAHKAPVAPKKDKSTKAPAATFVPKAEHPRAARMKRLGTYVLQTTKAGGITDRVAEISHKAYEIMAKERES